MPTTHMREDQIAGTAVEILNHQLDTLEEGVDHAIDSTKDTVHEFRSEAQDIIDHALNRIKEMWQEQQPKVEQYMASHPWLVMGGFLLIGCFLAGSRERARVS